MNKLRTGYVLCLTIFTIGLITASPALAVGFGPYFEYGRGISNDGFGTADFDDNRYSVGFALDTRVASDGLFNYRLNLGYQRTSRNFGGPGDVTYNGVTLNQMFGFGVYRSSLMRVWLGPSIRIGADIFNSNNVDVTAGGGLALGMNLHTGDVGSAALTFGYQYMYVGAVSSSVFGSSIDDAAEHLISVNLTYFFRSSGDRYTWPGQKP